MQAKIKTTIKLFIVVYALLLSAMGTQAATITVTNENDAGAGSLRQAVINAKSGDTIKFAPDVTHIILTIKAIGGWDMLIEKDLTICGGNDTTQKVTIEANNNSGTGIFVIGSPGIHIADNPFDTITSLNFTINNLILTGGFASGYGGYNGAVVHYDSGPNGNFIAMNCIFSKNTASDRGCGVVSTQQGNIMSINCTFSENTSSAGTVYTYGLTEFSQP